MARSASSSCASRIAEIDECSIAHILGNRAAEPGHGADTGLLKRADDVAQILRDRAGSECAVEPTRSQNMTVSCRRSASVDRAAETEAESGSVHPRHRRPGSMLFQI